MLQKTIYCFGVINQDILLYPVNQWPEPGGLEYAEQVAFLPGGTALNSALVIQQLGLSNVELLGCIGEDQAGDLIITALSERRIGSGGVLRIPGINTGVCVVTVNSSGERSLLYSAGANNSIRAFDFFSKRIEKGSMVHLGGVLDLPILAGKNLQAVVELLKGKNCFISVDLAWDWHQFGWDAIQPSLIHVDVVTLNQQEAFQITGENEVAEAAKMIHEGGCPFVVIKMGNQGAFVHRADFAGLVPGFKVKAVDCTGAGDAFSGALVSALSIQMPPVEAVRFANAAGACCVTQIGPIAGILNYSETMQFIHSQSNPDKD